MTLSPRLTGLVILTLLGSVLLGLVLFTGDGKNEESGAAVRLFTGDQIETMRVELPGRRAYALAERNGKWVLTDPVEAAADPATVDALMPLIENLVGLPLEFDAGSGRGSGGDEDFVPLSDYGIGGASEIRLILGSKSEPTREIFLGDPIPLDVGFVYGYLPATGSLYKVQREFKNLLDRSLFELRDKRLLRLDPATIVEIRFSSNPTVPGDAPLVLEKRGGWWEILSPEAVPADTPAVEELLATIAMIEALEFPPAAEAFPADAPASETSLSEGRLEFVTETGNTTVFRIGAGEADGTRLIAIGPGENSAGSVRVPAEPFRPAGLSLPGLRARRPLRFLPEEIETVTITTPEDVFDLVRREKAWRILRPQDSAADTRYVGRFLEGLRQLDAPAAVVSAPRPDEIRKNADFQFFLREGDGSEHLLWLMGSPTDDDTLYGASSFREESFTLDSRLVSRFSLNREAFADRRLISFDPTKVLRVEIERPEETTRIEKRGGGWLITSPRRIAARDARVWGLIFALEALNYRERRLGGAIDRDLQELMTIKLFMEEALEAGDEDERFESVSFFSVAADEEYYARISSEGEELFSLDPSSVKELSVDSKRLSILQPE